MAEDSPENKRTHTTRHAKGNALEIDPSKLKVRFAPHVREALIEVMDRIYEIQGCTKRDQAVLASLDTLASGKVNGLTLVTLVKDISEGIEAHTLETRDVRVRDAWNTFGDRLNAGSKPFTLVQKQSEQGRG